MTSQEMYTKKQKQRLHNTLMFNVQHGADNWELVVDFTELINPPWTEQLIGTYSQMVQLFYGFWGLFNVALTSVVFLLTKLSTMEITCFNNYA